MIRSQRLSMLGLLLCLAAASLPADAIEAQTEGDYLYRVTMLRAAPGRFMELIEAFDTSAEMMREAGDQAPFRLRHSQGDHWDFMLIYPMEDHSTFYSPERVRQRASVWGTPRGRSFQERFASLVSFTEEWFARSVAVDEMARRFDGMGLFHVEIFAGLPGKRGELLEQRRMENRYYEHLDRQLNLLFVRDSGPNWDAMTIGFYESLQAYAAAGVRYTAEQQDAAARAAGFDGVGSISPYLRSLLSYHNDTLGVPVG